MNTEMNHAQVASESFDFKGVETPKSTNYVKIGNYILSVEAAKFIQPEGVNSVTGGAKTPYIHVTFAGEAGQVQEKFFVSPKTLPRLQYLHLITTGKALEKPFESSKAVGAYFEKVLEHAQVKSKKLYMTVAGTESENGKIYGNLPYSNFVVDEDLAKKSGWTEGAFAEGSTEYNNFLTRSNKNVSHSTNDLMLPDTMGAPKIEFINDDSQDLPF